MVIPLSQLEYYLASVILKVQDARAHAMAQGTPISTEDPDSISISCVVIDETKPLMTVSVAAADQPDTETVTTKTPERSTSTTKQTGQVTKEKQVSQPGRQITRQEFGRGTQVTVEETN
jgi:kynurenine formamidase